MPKSEVIKVRGTAPSDNVSVYTEFNYDMPSTIDEAILMFGDEGAFSLFQAALTIALQAPARKILTEEWEDIEADQRTQYVQAPQKEGGQATSTLPPEAQQRLQEFMATWKPGTKLARTRIARPVDPVKALMDSWDTLSPERQEAILAQIQNRFGQTA